MPEETAKEVEKNASGKQDLGGGIRDYFISFVVFLLCTCLFDKI